MVVCPSCGEENPDRARFCLACGHELTGPRTIGEERKVVSVLFVDLVGFTDRSDRADPEDVRATLRPYHERVKADIEGFGGTVEKFIGDAVMAVFGAPIAHEDDAERALRAALRILETMEELRGEGLDVAVRAAVTTGEAVVALAARPERGEGIVAGDVVNTAARLQSAAPVGAVIVDAATMRSAEGAIAFEELEPVEAKGKQEPIPVWRATMARSRFGIDTELRAETLFVGRDSELALLGETFSRALREPSTQLLTVVGEPGVGKSRLVWEFREEIDRRPDLIRWRQGRCLPYGEGITFWALGEIVKAEAGVLETDSHAQALEKLVHTLEGIDDESERSWFSERLAPLVGAQDDVTGVGREEAFSAWRRYLEALAAQRPTVLVVEDLHWADAAVLDFVEHLLDWAADVPLMVLATARPELYETRPDWGGGRRNSATLGLSPLSDADTARLVSSLLQRSVLPAETQAALLERAGGNPLYAEQFVHMLGEGTASGMDLPETVQALISARLDTLSPELKSLLQDASVLGKVFWTGALATMGSRSRDDVLSGLRELVRREFVRPSRLSSMRDEEEFSFWHVLVRDVAYQQIPRAARGRKHVQAAEWIEHVSEGRLADQAEFLAHHYAQALDLGRAAGDSGDGAELGERFVRFSVLAGDRAMNLDVGIAETAYRRALEAAGSPEAAAPAQAKLAEALGELGKLVEAESAYEEAVGLFGKLGDERQEALAKLGLSRALWRHGQTARARALTYEVVEALEDGGGPDLVLAYSRAAAADVIGGRAREGLAWADKGFALARDLGIEGTAPVVRLLQMRGIARIDLGDRSGLEDMRAALELSLELGIGIDTGTSYLNYAENLARFEPLAVSDELLEASLDFARRRGLTHHEMWTRMAMLWHLYESGRWDELLSEAEEIGRWDVEQGGTQIEVGCNLISVPVLVHRGALDEARRRVQLFLPRAREIEDVQTLQPSLAIAALVYFASDDREEALSLVGELEALTRGNPNRRVEELVQSVHIAVASGAIELAERLLAGSVDATQNLPTRSVLAMARALVTEARGESDAARELYRAAAAGWEEWGSVVGRAYALLGLGRCGDDEATREGMAIFERLRATPLTAVARAA